MVANLFQYIFYHQICLNGRPYNILFKITNSKQNARSSRQKMPRVIIVSKRNACYLKKSITEYVGVYLF